VEVQVNLFFFTTQEDVQRRLFVACARGGTEWSDGLVLELAAVSVAGGWAGHIDSVDGLVKKHLCLET